MSDTETAPRRASFLRTIFKNVSLGEAIRIELEDDIGFLVRYLPGILGYVLRYLAYKPLMRRLDGLPYISTNVKFMHMHNIALGRRVLINSNSYLYGKGGIDIGDGVLISPNCVIVAGDHDFSSTLPILEQPSSGGRIVIGADCWIAANVVITGGVTIGKGSIIGAGAVVTRDTEPYSINAGVPARKIGERSVADRTKRVE